MKRLFSASKNIMTDKRINLNEDKLHELLFPPPPQKNKSTYLKRIDQASRTPKNEDCL